MCVSVCVYVHVFVYVCVCACVCVCVCGVCVYACAGELVCTCVSLGLSVCIKNSTGATVSQKGFGVLAVKASIVTESGHANPYLRHVAFPNNYFKWAQCRHFLNRQTRRQNFPLIKKSVIHRS